MVGNGGRITLISADEQKTIDWVSTLRANARGSYQYQSFAPPRPHINAKWYINSREYPLRFRIYIKCSFTGADIFQMLQMLYCQQRKTFLLLDGGWLPKCT